jgi:hypothetical protein
VETEVVDERARDRLNDVVNVDWLTTGVRPQAHVGLLGLEEMVDHDRGLVKKRALLIGLCGRQLRDTRHMPFGLDHERSNSERPDAVLHAPERGLMDQPAGQMPTA